MSARRMLGCALLMTCGIYCGCGSGRTATSAGSATSRPATAPASATVNSCRDAVARATRLVTLGPLPQGGWVDCDAIENMFSASYAIVVRTTMQEADQFIAATPAIANATPEVFSPTYQYISYDDAWVGGNIDPAAERHKLYHPRSDFPFYRPTVRVKGCRYAISAPDAVSGEVVVDEDAGLLYVYIRRS